ncbi:MAG: hypothetical protein JST17_14025 [Bacteroidetes bacterium]|nr:hypothetical protein [Bacteroidota bacterium]
MSVGLLAVRLLYRFYVCVHLSKWFTFFSFLVVCLLWWCRPLHLLPTDRGLAQFCGGGRRSRAVSYKTSQTSGISRHRIAPNPMMADSGS